MTDCFTPCYACARGVIMAILLGGDPMLYMHKLYTEVQVHVHVAMGIIISTHIATIFILM
jgi:hypothetical protein